MIIVKVVNKKDLKRSHNSMTVIFLMVELLGFALTHCHSQKATIRTTFVCEPILYS
jgi:hypothetical protein